MDRRTAGRVRLAQPPVVSMLGLKAVLYAMAAVILVAAIVAARAFGVAFMPPLIPRPDPPRGATSPRMRTRLATTRGIVHTRGVGIEPKWGVSCRPCLP
jgi:hypothetical protein